MAARRRPARRPQGGRPTRLLDPGVSKTLIDALELGVPISIACQGVGIAEQSYRNWLNRGAAEHEARAEDGHEADENEDPYVEFYLSVIEARTKAATRNVAVIQKAAQGGVVTSRTVRKYVDNEGNLVEEETVNRTAPDWRAAAWYLERSHRSEYAKEATAIEVTGAGGGPIQYASNEEELAARLEEFLAAGVPSLVAAEQIPLEITGPDDPDGAYDVEVIESAMGDETA